ncbi:helix-turn-helix domain-containing protein [Chryseobacterium sp. Mn2064]|uniref:helix-turn-helix domain-containing protein n=1 Tax=Chryseobacterium sp. Mn2064 TaxID=3395263 RepID=UPI003BD375C8
MIKYSEKTDNLRWISPIKNTHYTVLICSEGSAMIKIGFHHFEIVSGTITILPPEVLISTQNVSDNLNVKQVFFTKVFLQKIILKEGIIDELLLLNNKYPPMYVYELNQRFNSVKEKFVQIKGELHSTYAYHLDIIRLIIIEILYEYNRACEYCLLGFEKTMNRNYQLTYEFKKLVDEHFSTWNSIGQYASHLGISAKHLTEVIKEETGNTALQIIHERILLESQYLLKHTTCSIKECAHQLGFETASYFSRFFKRYLMISPNDYRKSP